MVAGDVTALWPETEKGLFRGTEDSLVTQELPLDPRSPGPCDTEDCKKKKKKAALCGSWRSLLMFCSGFRRSSSDTIELSEEKSLHSPS